ncbi:CBS domain-containing protein [Lutibacter agarilyticus]|uniref:CBS domain-containing protein n=1 Tax=Lutibacter agarilyticus TaxID=1109740 RepID=A0A238YA63_9FLAO|nr:CBS domain-containing protein [Lutibacter agarilyticus]SNR67513.1 CBS domain-containing protein [Lutibacter agarilyticus]
METAPYILNEFEAFSLETSVNEVKTFFNETTYSHFPIVKENHLIGLISETDIEGIDEDEKEIGYFQYLFNLFSTHVTTNILEIITTFASNETNIVPVIDTQKNYIGYFDLTDVLHAYNETPFLKNNGTVMVLEKEVRGFSFSEICQIIESNGGKIQGLFISEKNETTVKITVKFDSQDVNEILQSFRRYEYEIISSHEEDFYLEDLKERSKYLQKYLNI